ncbi:hypothetical protein GCM10014715_60380 [Streptomyces spiralis]|uniref:Uncharacterized protein n=1 Tax=Streptomyces spiralis TaxID=66376 RepID=A0A919E027_9ACTN|nr:hypothetical protein GCM10014715_60380 [Streptomyces spiralis]
MDTKAEAHNTTVTVAAAVASRDWGTFIMFPEARRVRDKELADFGHEAVRSPGSLPGPGGPTRTGWSRERLGGPVGPLEGTGMGTGMGTDGSRPNRTESERTEFSAGPMPRCPVGRRGRVRRSV